VPVPQADGPMERVQQSESNAQQKFLTRIRECADMLATIEFRGEILCDAACIFKDFAGASDAILIDLSRDSLDIYRSNEEGEDGEERETSTTVILEESVGPLLELLCDRYLQELGIRIFNQKIVDPLEGLDEDSISKALDELGMTQGFILPLTVARNFGTENVLGILLINGVPSHRFADPAHLAMLRVAADLLSVSADNRDLGNALARLRPTDQVTGLASKNRLISQLNQEIMRAQYLNRSFALVLGDIDNFKSLNVRQGYRYGDLVLKTIADDLLAESRPIDTVCRWSGEAFLVLMPEIDADEAFDFAERCRKKVGEHPITPNDYCEEVFVTMSFGVAMFPDHGEKTDLLLRNVDLALLQSKLNGRNQSIIWSPEWTKHEI
jgi:diguanylate cyclase (GGDEF)-like protein